MDRLHISHVVPHLWPPLRRNHILFFSAEPVLRAMADDTGATPGALLEIVDDILHPEKRALQKDALLRMIQRLRHVSAHRRQAHAARTIVEKLRWRWRLPCAANVRTGLRAILQRCNAARQDGPDASMVQPETAVQNCMQQLDEALRAWFGGTTNHGGGCTSAAREWSPIRSCRRPACWTPCRTQRFGIVPNRGGCGGAVSLLFEHHPTR